MCTYVHEAALVHERAQEQLVEEQATLVTAARRSFDEVSAVPMDARFVRPTSLAVPPGRPHVIYLVIAVGPAGAPGRVV